MKIFRFEMKMLAVPFASWTFTLLATMAGLVWGVFPLYMEAKDELNVVLEGFPPQFLQMFGMAGDLFTFEGFYSFSYLYIGILAAIFALVLSVGAFYRERRTKSLDFLLTRPVSRSTIFIAKLAAVLVWILISTAIYVAAFVATVRLVDLNLSVNRSFLHAGFAILGVELVFVAIGTFLAVYLRKIRSVAGLAATGGMVAFVLSALHNLVDKDEMRWITPLKYFDVYHAFDKGTYETKYVLAAIGLILIATGLAYLKFVRQDAKQV